MLDSEPILDAGSPNKRPAGYQHITQPQLGVILRLTAEGRPQTVIAAALGISQAGVSKALKRLGSDSTDLARHHLKARSYTTARRLTKVAEKGKDGDAVKAAKLVLAASGVIEGVTGVTVGVQVVIGGAQQPAFDSSSITVESAGNALDATVATLPVESERV
jgi:hypothetical protein